MLLGTTNLELHIPRAVYDKNKLQALRYHSLAYFHGHSVGGTNPSLLEALGCSNLIIAHDNIFNREVVGEIGFYFSGPNDIPSLVQQIESLSKERIEFLKNKAETRIEGKYNWDAIADSYMEILMEDVK